MQKNWYVVQTKPHYESKASQLLTKKGIENFCPVNREYSDIYKKNKVIEKPLFQRYVFVHMHLSEATVMKKTFGIINFVFWKGEPAIITEQEIEVIKDFTSNYANIKLEKVKVNENEKIKYIDGPNYSVDGKVFSSKNKTLKLYLPSLGFNMVSKISEDSFYQKETIFLQRNSFTHS